MRGFSSRRSRVRALVAAAAAIIAVLSGVHAEPTPAPSREDQFKAAYLFNFVKFVEWPAASASDVLTVCFVSASGVLDALNVRIDEKRVGTRRLVTRSVKAGDTLSGCDALYVDSTAIDLKHYETVSDAPVLTVSDAKSFARDGGMIELFAENNRLRFNVNLARAQKAGLRINANLLQLAATVEKGDK